MTGKQPPLDLQLKRAVPHHSKTLTLAAFVNALNCPHILKFEAIDKTHRTMLRVHAALKKWKKDGCPDLGGWPDTSVELLDEIVRRIYANH